MMLSPSSIDDNGLMILNEATIQITLGTRSIQVVTGYHARKSNSLGNG